MPLKTVEHGSHGAQRLDAHHTRFTLWAPDAFYVSLELRDGRSLPLIPQADGWFALEVACPAGTRYRFNIDGDIEVIQVNPSKTLKKDPIGAESKFFNISSRAVGDVQALNPQQLERTKSKILPFPSDIEMVMRCSENLKMAIRGAIMNDRRFIQ